MTNNRMARVTLLSLLLVAVVLVVGCGDPLEVKSADARLARAEIESCLLDRMGFPSMDFEERALYGFNNDDVREMFDDVLEIYLAVVGIGETTDHAVLTVGWLFGCIWPASYERSSEA